nr:hypothetical protein [Tanacetum cinerariifolium]
MRTHLMLSIKGKFRPAECKASEGNKDQLTAKHQLVIKGLADGKASVRNLKDIQIKDIVKEVKDYLKTYSSAEMDIRWFLIYLDGLEPYLLEILENRPLMPLSHLSTPTNPLPKPQNQWSHADRWLANQDKRLKSIIISYVPTNVMKSAITCTSAKVIWTDLILIHEGPSESKDTKIGALRLKFNTFKALEGEKVNGTFTRLRSSLNDLENKGVLISQAKVNATCVNSLPRKWLSMNQIQRANNSIKNDTLQLCMASTTIKKDSDSIIKEDQMSNSEFLADLNAEFHERALLANQRRFYKRFGRVEGNTRRPLPTLLKLFGAEPFGNKKFVSLPKTTQTTNEVVSVNVKQKTKTKSPHDPSTEKLLLTLKQEGEAINTASYTQNRSIIVKRHGKATYDVFIGRSLDISYFMCLGVQCTFITIEITLDSVSPEDHAELLHTNNAQVINELDHLESVDNLEHAEIEPERLIEALEEEGWLSVMQEELNQFERNKAILVAQVYKQEEGIDYDKIFTPVARLEAIRIFLAYAEYIGFIVYQIDVKSAFLNGKISEEVYVQQPRRFESSDFPNHVCKLDKAFYGLKQAPKAWYETLLKFLIQHKFVRGFQIKQDFRGISICQEKYVKDLLKKYDIIDTALVKCPMLPPNNLGPDESGVSVNETVFRGMIGSLMYLTANRPNIQFSTCLCARYQANPKESHPVVVKRIFRKSTSGGCQRLGVKLVCWSAKKQSSMAMSLAEAGYVRDQEFHKLHRGSGGKFATHNPTMAAAAAGSCCCRCSAGGGVGGDEWWGYGGSGWRWWRVAAG